MTDDLVKRVDSLVVLLNMERKKSLSLGKHIEKLEAALRNVAVTLDSEEIPYMVRNRYACATAKEALGDKNETVVI